MVRAIACAILVLILSASAFAKLPLGAEVQVDVGMPGAISTDEFPSSYAWKGSHILGGGLLIPLISKQSPSDFSLSVRVHGAFYKFKSKHAIWVDDWTPVRINNAVIRYTGVYSGLQVGLPSPTKYAAPYISASLGYLSSHDNGYYGNYSGPESGCGAEAALGASIALAKHQSLFVEGLAVADLYSSTAAHFWGVRTGIGIH